MLAEDVRSGLKSSMDYWNTPDGSRQELIYGVIYNQAAPSRIHQRIVSRLSQKISNYIDSKKGSCEVYVAPFAVNIDASDKNWVEPDISIVCDKNKLSERGCVGSPDLIIEVVSPSSRKMDYCRKNLLYSENGVQEYWIVDPDRKITTIYKYEDITISVFKFDETFESSIFRGLEINITALI